MWEKAQRKELARQRKDQGGIRASEAWMQTKGSAFVSSLLSIILLACSRRAGAGPFQIVVETWMKMLAGT
jgi:hypothetical protein